MAAAFAFTDAAVANQRQKDDELNGVAGGCAAGFLAGLRGMYILHNSPSPSDDGNCYLSARSLPLAISSCAVIGAAIGTLEYAGDFRKPAAPLEARRAAFFKHPPPYSNAEAS